MRISQQEKYEIIRLVAGSDAGIKRTLEELGINKSTFYIWYKQYLKNGYDGLAPSSTKRNQVWNKIPQEQKNEVVEVALEKTEMSSRELAWHITDTRKWFISESSVYRILKERGLITSPAYVLMAASDSFKDKTSYKHEMWQTDFTYFFIVGWGWYYLSTVLDDYIRYIIAWDLCENMKVPDVMQTVNKALYLTGLSKNSRPKLLSDNGPCYIAHELKDYLMEEGIKHIHGKPMHPQTQGKIERYHRSMKNIVKLDHYYSPDELRKAIETFVHHYNNHRYHESLNNLTPADVYYGRAEKILKQRELIKTQTIMQRRKFYIAEKLSANYV